MRSLVVCAGCAVLVNAHASAQEPSDPHAAFQLTLGEAEVDAAPASGFEPILPDLDPAAEGDEVVSLTRLTVHSASWQEPQTQTGEAGVSLDAPPHTGAVAGEGGGETGDSDLAKKLQNPVAALISVPFQFNYDEGFGPKDAGRMTLNIQPVIPISLNEDWNLISRTILPVIYQGSIADGVDSDFGLGDVLQSVFFAPKEPIGGWILGFGPVALLPTGTEPGLRSEQLGLGPTIVALRQHSGWTYGALVNHVWGVTPSDSHDEVNSTFIQPFLSHTWPSATTLALNAEATYDWSGEELTLPINLQLAQLVKFGRQPVQFQIGGRYYADSPDGGPEWGLRFTITFLFPK